VRLHSVVGGDGPPLLLVHGWPQTWYQWRLVMPALARDFQVVAVDQRGIGLSDKPQEGYDAGTQAADMVAVMRALGHEQFAMVGFDTGMPIGYALAADHPDRLERLVVGEAVIPGITPSPPLIASGPANEAFWHLTFNRLTKLNEQLVSGREDLFFGFQFDENGRRLPNDAIEYYIDAIASSPDSLRGSFGTYRAFDETIAQNEQRKTRKLSLPVLAVGGEKGVGVAVGVTMKLVGYDVDSVIIPGSGHWVAEEVPDLLLAALAEFLAPYREVAAHGPATAAV
jgi:pimeloyl-ACP methyl ester carboxylesterase